MGRSSWTKERTDRLVSLYKEGITLDKMSEILDIPITTIKARLRAVRQEYSLPYRDPKQIKRKARPKTVVTAYDKAFSGPIPCGHWMITKKWELTDKQKEALDEED